MMKFDATYSGRTYKLKDGAEFNWNENGRMAAAYANTSSIREVTLTGYTTTTQSGTVMYQTTSGWYIDLSDGWKEVGTELVAHYTQSEAQQQVNTVIANNKKILEHNILCARYANKLTSDEKLILRQLQKNLTIRNQQLLEDGLCSNIQTSFPSGYQYLSQYLTDFCDKYDRGEIGSLTVTIVVTAIVIASLSTAAFFVYRAYAIQSENDVKFSDQLTKSLMAKLTPEEYQQLLNETKGIVTKSRLKQSLSTFWSTSKMWIFGALALVGGSILYKTIKEQRR